MAVFVPVSAVEVPPTTTQASDIPNAGAGGQTQAQAQAQAQAEFAPFVAFLQDHFVQGGFRGGKMVADFMQTIQQSADAGKSEFVRNLPTLANHLRDMPGAVTALFSEDPRAICEVERRFGNFSRDVASATSTGVLVGISRLVSTALPFTVAAGAVVGAAVGAERIEALLVLLRQLNKED